MDSSEIKGIGFIGAGKMAEGIIKGLLKSSLITSDGILATDIDTKRLEALKEHYHIKTGPIHDVVNACEVIFLSVKPQNAEQVFDELRALSLKEKCFLSIMAGVPTSRIEEALVPGTAVIRIMPNIAATVQAAASAYCLGKWVTEDHAALAQGILETFGTATRVEEKWMDAVTGLSGSGPAYVFTFIEALSDGGVLMGLPRDTALSLAVQTLYGAAKLLTETGEHPAVLREKVTSPGGTTIHGLSEMEKNGFRNTVIQAVARATERSKELGEK